MKLSVFSKIISEMYTRLMILKASTIYTFQEDTAYVVENWSAVVSTIAYTLSFALFIKVVFTNVDSIAGYNENEMLFFLFMGQVSFYTQFLTYDQNVKELAESVNTGVLDLLLTKPIPSLFYISFKRISIVSFIRDAIPSLIIMGLFVNWSELNINSISIITGIVIFLLGMSALYCFSVLTVLPVFWIGRNRESYLLGHRLQWLGRREIPFEGFNKKFQFVLTALIPVLITTGLSVSVILNKRDLFPALVYVLLVTILFQFIKTWAWRKALKAYSSASS